MIEEELRRRYLADLELAETETEKIAVQNAFDVQMFKLTGDRSYIANLLAIFRNNLWKSVKQYSLGDITLKQLVAQGVTDWDNWENMMVVLGVGTKSSRSEADVFFDQRGQKLVDLKNNNLTIDEMHHMSSDILKNYFDFFLRNE